LSCSEASVAQQKTSTRPSPEASLNEKFAKPEGWGKIELKLFKDSPDFMAFRLLTSWIPGEDHKGRFRYKLTATPRLVGEYASEPRQIGILSDRVQNCSISLILSDVYGFELRRVPVLFGTTVNSESETVGLLASTSVQMDLSEYKSFIGNDVRSGTWNIGWNCPSN
jgi:hypothetical protein